MKVLVTGGAGFIGSHVSQHFASIGAKVVVLDNLSRAKLLRRPSLDASNNWNYLKRHCPTVELVRGDVRSPQQVNKVAHGAEVIVHAGGQVAVTSSLEDPKTDFEINALGTLNVLEAARQNDSAVVYCSTNKVYGENVNSIPLRELSTRYEYADSKFADGVPEHFSVDLTHHSPYGCSKLAADLYTQDYAHAYSLKTGVFRLSCIYGTRQYGVEDQGWLAWFLRAALRNIPLTIYGNGKQVRDVLWVEDLVRAFESFVRGSSRHEVFNIGGGPDNTLSLLEILSIVRKITGKEIKVAFSDWREADQKVYVSNVKKAYEKLKWKPRIDVYTGVSKLAEWMKSLSQ